jgi:hypothetical protein
MLVCTPPSIAVLQDDRVRRRCPWRLVTECPAVEASAQNYILPAAIEDGTLKRVFRISAADNDENSD